MRTAVLFTASAHDSQARTLVRDEQEPKQWDLGLLGLVSDGASSPSANTHRGWQILRPPAQTGQHSLPKTPQAKSPEFPSSQEGWCKEEGAKGCE